MWIIGNYDIVIGCFRLSFPLRFLCASAFALDMSFELCPKKMTQWQRESTALFRLSPLPRAFNTSMGFGRKLAPPTCLAEARTRSKDVEEKRR